MRTPRSTGTRSNTCSPWHDAITCWGVLRGSRQPTAVNVHDYPHDAPGRAVPYGVYDVTTNRGFMCLRTSGDTPAFAVDTISGWWQTEARAAYPKADHLLLLADAGGSNEFQIRAWKERLQVQFCDRFGLTVPLCHYPTGCSKWNRSSTDSSVR
jgi:Rhodopirellula transposase DDE domain